MQPIVTNQSSLNMLKFSVFFVKYDTLVKIRCVQYQILRNLNLVQWL